MTTELQADKAENNRQYLTFKLANEDYGVEILKVQEIRGWEAVREIPNTPGYIKGALNLRGAVVPIIDLRERFDMEQVEYSPVTVVIVLCIGNVSDNLTMGIVADAVSDVLHVNPDDVREAPKLGSKIDTCYMQGMYVEDQRMVMLLDVDHLFNPDEIENIQ